MNYSNTTQVPNRFFDHLLPHLTLAETKILLVIIRQTYGWIDRYTKERKKRDCISYGQFIQKTGLSRRIITDTMKSLVEKNAIFITDMQGCPLPMAQDRIGSHKLFYSANLMIAWTQPKTPKSSSRAKHIGQIVGNMRI